MSLQIEITEGQRDEILISILKEEKEMISDILHNNGGVSEKDAHFYHKIDNALDILLKEWLGNE